MIAVLNYVDGVWVEPPARESLQVVNPATGEVIARTPLCEAAGVDAAARAAAAAFPAWRRTPVAS